MQRTYNETRQAQRKARTLVSAVEFNTHTKWMQASPAYQPSVLHKLSKSQQLKAFQMSDDFLAGSQHRFQATQAGEEDFFLSGFFSAEQYADPLQMKPDESIEFNNPLHESGKYMSAAPTFLLLL